MKNTTSTQKIDGVFSPDERNNIPELPGVYLYKDTENKILYIGKAKNLRKRVASYFIKTPIFLKTHLLVQQIALIDIIIVDNEKEALFLEATLIKKHLPKFNVNFKDGKFYPYIKITSKEKYPRIFMTRNNIEDGSIYFGPYVSAGVVRSTLEVIQKVFQIRTCKTLPKKECLEFHMGRCSAPCINNISIENYKKNIKSAIKFLSGKKEFLINELTTQMKQASQDLLFEKAQIYKNQLDAIYALDDDQHVLSQNHESIDIIGIVKHINSFGITISLIRDGKLSGKMGYIVQQNEANFSIANILEEFIISHYSEDPIHYIIIDQQFQDLIEPLSDYFKELNIDLKISIPKDTREQALLVQSNKNAFLNLEKTRSEPNLSTHLSNLQKTLSLKNFPNTIEGFDVAKLDGTLASGVAVQFESGEPNKDNYRLYNIRSENQQDDFIAMEEMLLRHYGKILKESSSLPDLIVIDGGKGQLTSAMKALKELGIESIDIISIAKKEEEIFIPNKKKSIILAKNSPELHLIQRIRDEAHRFSQHQLHRRMDKKLKS